MGPRGTSWGALRTFEGAWGNSKGLRALLKVLGMPLRSREVPLGISEPTPTPLLGGYGGIHKESRSNFGDYGTLGEIQGNFKGSQNTSLRVIGVLWKALGLGILGVLGIPLGSPVYL